jgi:hypothetical protein
METMGSKPPFSLFQRSDGHAERCRVGKDLKSFGEFEMPLAQLFIGCLQSSQIISGGLNLFEHGI